MNSQQIRACSDLNNCGTFNSQPVLSRTCQMEICSESWSCGSWLECVDGLQSRNCVDIKNCGTSLAKPIIKQKCIVATKTTKEFPTAKNITTAATSKTEEKSEEVLINSQKATFEKGNDGTSTISIKGLSASTNLNIFVKGSRLYVNTAKGTIEIQVSPIEVFAKANKIDNISSIKLIEENNELFYIISGTQRANLFIIFPVLAEIEMKVNAATGEIVSGKKPWWSSLAVWFN